jgi:hypothetical protein
VMKWISVLSTKDLRRFLFVLLSSFLVRVWGFEEWVGKKHPKCGKRRITSHVGHTLTRSADNTTRMKVKKLKKIETKLAPKGKPIVHNLN